MDFVYYKSCFIDSFCHPTCVKNVLSSMRSSEEDEKRSASVERNEETGDGGVVRGEGGGD